MTLSTADLPILTDLNLPTADLLGEAAIDLIGAAYAPLGAKVIATRPTQTTYYPGRSLTVLHDTKVRGADGATFSRTVALAVGRKVPSTATVLNDGAHDIVVWEFPTDPWLRGLGAALNAATLEQLFADLDLPATTINTKLRAYRPGRRAVIEVYGPGARTFLKVVRPSAAETLHQQHEHLAQHVAVPASMGYSSDLGIVVLQALDGVTLRHGLMSNMPLPGPEALLSVLDQLPDPLSSPAAHESTPQWRAHEFATMLSAVAPDLEDRLNALAVGIAPFEAASAGEPLVAVHGDFYEAQLLVDRSSIRGILDVDTFGWGRRVEDLATMIGHLVVLAIGSPQRVAIERYAARLLAGFDRTVDPSMLRAAIASVVLGLATGPFRVLEPNWHHHTVARVASAEAWLASAQKIRA